MRNVNIVLINFLELINFNCFLIYYAYWNGNYFTRNFTEKIPKSNQFNKKNFLNQVLLYDTYNYYVFEVYPITSTHSRVGLEVLVCAIPESNKLFKLLRTAKTQMNLVLVI